MIEITYTCNEFDFVRAGLLMLRKRSFTTIVLSWTGGLTLVSIVISLVMNPDLRASSFSADSLPRTVAGFALPLLLTCMPLYTRHALRKQYRNSPAIGENRTLVFDDFGYKTSSLTAEGTVAWSLYVGWYEDQYNFVLGQQGRRIFVPIPKRQLSGDQITALQSLFKEKIRLRSS